MNSEECKAQVNRILIKDFEVSPERLTENATLNQDLGLDSLDAVDLVVSIEHEFGCRIKEEDLKNIKSLGDIYSYIEQHAPKAD